GSGSPARVVVETHGQRRAHRRRAADARRLQRGLRVDGPPRGAGERDFGGPGVRPALSSPGTAAAGGSPHEAIMDFLRKWLVGRDLKRARALEGEGYLDRALGVYESCLEMANPAERIGALRGIGSCGLRLGKLARAREALAECVKLAPGDPDALLLLAQVQMELR